MQNRVKWKEVIEKSETFREWSCSAWRRRRSKSIKFRFRQGCHHRVQAYPQHSVFSSEVSCAMCGWSSESLHRLCPLSATIAVVCFEAMSCVTSTGCRIWKILWANIADQSANQEVNTDSDLTTRKMESPLYPREYSYVQREMKRCLYGCKIWSVT